jgi:hypothetical protein
VQSAVKDEKGKARGRLLGQRKGAAAHGGEAERGDLFVGVDSHGGGSNGDFLVSDDCWNGIMVL